MNGRERIIRKTLIRRCIQRKNVSDEIEFIKNKRGSDL